MRRMLLSLLLVALLGACDAVTEAVGTMKEGLKHAQAISDDVEKAAGTRAKVSVNWKNGELEKVSFDFDRVPKDVRIAELAEAARASIRRHYPEEPRELVIAFSLGPTKPKETSKP